MAQLRQKLDGADAFWTDDWDGYPANRTRLLKRIGDTRVSNPVVVGGDIHSFFANDLHLDFDDPASPVVATEFVGTSISSYPAALRDCSRKRCPTIRTSISSKAGGAAMSASISSAPACRCACASCPTRTIPRPISRR